MDHLHEFDSHQYPTRVVEALEPQHGLYPSFDAAVILFYDAASRIMPRGSSAVLVLLAEVSFLRSGRSA